MSESRARKLLRNLDHVVYWWAAAPVLGRLPPALGYRIACWRGDWFFRSQAGKRSEMARNLRLVLGNEVSPAAARADNPRLVPPLLLRGGRLQRGCGTRRGRCGGWSRSVAGNTWRPRWPQAGEPSSAPATSAPTAAPSRCCTPAASRSPRSGAGGTNTIPASHPPSGGCGTCTPGRCGATGSGRTSSHGRAGPGRGAGSRRAPRQ